jgi:hypothetical protein
MQESRIASKRNTKERGYRIDSSTSCLTVVFLSKKDVQEPEGATTDEATFSV